MYGYFMEMLHINHFSWIFLLLCRFNTHETQTMPIIEHYEKLGLVKKIQAIKSPSEVNVSSFNDNRQLMSLPWHLLVVIKINLLFSTNIAKYCTTFFFLSSNQNFESSSILPQFKNNRETKFYSCYSKCFTIWIFKNSKPFLLVVSYATGSKFYQLSRE